MTDGLKLTNIGIKNVIGKTNRSDSKPGIVVISFENLVQKKSVLKEKRLLKNSSKYSNVFIENDLPLQQRIVNNNNHILFLCNGRSEQNTCCSYFYYPTASRYRYKPLKCFVYSSYAINHANINTNRPIQLLQFRL